MAEMHAVTAEQLTDIADAIRAKRDTVAPMTVDDMPLEISLIDGGGGGSWSLLFDKTLTADTRTINFQDIPESASEVIIIVNGRVNDANNTLTTGSQSAAISAGNTGRMYYGNAFFIRSSGLFPWTIHLFQADSLVFGCCFLSTAGINTSASTSTVLGCSPQNGSLQNLKIDTTNNDRLIKAGTRLICLYR